MIEGKKSSRDEYNSLMLWMIAQPTRKCPDKLPRFDENLKAPQGQEPVKRTGESILNELLTKWG